MRRAARLRRLAIPLAERHRCARHIARLLLDRRKLRCARHIGIYLSQGSELGTAPAIRALLAHDIQVYVPVVTRLPKKRELYFVRLDKTTPLRRAAYGIREPVRRTRHRVARRLDVVLVPLVAFDDRGGRLGQGGGYYDRSFARRCARRPLLVGYAYHVQRVDTLPLDAWDVRLDAILTERGFHKCRAFSPFTAGAP
ncbi:MAG: 5-formyltetrahydrofolate cyclo-ligase [Nevskiaceae bacterium]|nr:MAG: 5-formyltetrahydrofolate cyclo-ligase [Nevskiaceae bacterium]TBR75103.1 MAG: 5-formyltetrahydrofolate cyclo-ligase [Nevskiaceae bacterium]